MTLPASPQMHAVVLPPPSSVAAARAEFSGGAGYLAACTVGLPTRASLAAMIADAESAASGRPDITGYSSSAERSRAHFAHIVGVDPTDVAIGSQASVFAGLLAAAVPDGTEVLCPKGDFSSLVMPFVHAGRGISVRVVPLDRIAHEITPMTSLVAFSVVQSATGEVADIEGIVDAARRHGTRTVCDATQAVGWMPVDATKFDALICHAYKWLCAPRGVAFLTVARNFVGSIPPIFAGWYSGEDPWTSCYGHEVALAPDATRFDLSPAWQAFVGAEPALELFARLDRVAVHSHTTGLASAFRSRMNLPEPDRATPIVTWADPTGCDLDRLTAAGITASGRAGRARVAFHVFNHIDDVNRAASALLH